MLVSIEGTQYMKDTRTTAVLTVDRSVLSQNAARKAFGARVEAKNESINRLENDVTSLKEDIQEIKMLLKQLSGIGK